MNDLNIGDRVRVNLKSEIVRKLFPGYHAPTVNFLHGRTGTVLDVKYTDDNPNKPSVRFIALDTPVPLTPSMASVVVVVTHRDWRGVWLLPLELEKL